MINEVKSFSPDRLLGVARAFTHFLALSNAAESHFQHKRRRDKLLLADESFLFEEDTCAGVIKKLIEENKLTPKEIIDVLAKQHVEIVLTAHPTEVNRRTILRKHSRIQDILAESDHPDLLSNEKKELDRALRSEITAIWESDELRRSKPSPVDEANTGFAIVETVLWHALPSFLRKLDNVVGDLLHEKLPLDFAPIKIASWMGGDRDGNPNVTAPITREVTYRSRWWAATLLKSDIKRLHEELSIRSGSQELFALAGNVREPYRKVLKDLENKLADTISWLDEKITNKESTVSALSIPLKNSSEILDPLKLLYRSLVETADEDIANGLLLDTIRRLSAFGLCLTPLDIRQESGRHTEALDAITRFLGVGSYAQWDEAELSNRRPLLPRGRPLDSYNFPTTVVDTLSTFELAANTVDGSFGAYVISHCKQASDVLAVMLLQLDAGVPKPLRVVPLFETLDDLVRAPATVDALFSLPGYRGRIGGHQEIMVGYSDSAKDAGRMAAYWAQYIAQKDIVAVADKHGVDITFFHGKGGSIGRGGNPEIFKAILAHPPGTVNGRFRVTEQGEMITQNLGHMQSARRTLEVFTAAVLAERFQPHVEPKKEWREMMNLLAEKSCDVYRQLVRQDERFVPYFRTATPESELSGLNVGSRPAKRNPSGGVESLRAIPWVFSWTQTRLNLPTWLGIGDSLEHAMKDSKHKATLQEMYTEWSWFRTLIDLIEMIVLKSEKRIAKNYDDQLVKDAKSRELGEALRAKLDQTGSAVLAVSQHSKLQEGNPALLHSLNVRNPYIDPLNVIQAELLRRLRDENESLSEEQKVVLKDALLITINGVANGLRNSG
eukprot:gene334-345_t